MGNSGRKNRLSGVLMASCALSILFSSSAFASGSTAVLTGIDIKSSGNNTYKIEVKTDKNVPVEKFVTASDKLVIDLKDTQPSSFVNTVYNNATNIDHVIIQPVSNDKVRIFIQGQGVSSSNVSLNTGFLPDNQTLSQNTTPDPVTPNSAVNTINAQNTAESVAQQSVPQPQSVQNSVQPTSSSETIVLDQPINSFRPADDAISSSDIESGQSSTHFSLAGLKKVFSTSGFDWILRILTLGVLLVAGIKMLKPKKQVKINLASTSNENFKEIDLMKSRQNLLKQELQKGNPSVLNKKSGYGAASRYALKEYQNSQLPPAPRNMGISSRIVTDSSPLRPTLNPQPAGLKRTPSARAVAPLGSKIRKNDLNMAQSNLEGIQFLESMAKIYEKSGRVDLARDIQYNIQKAKVAG